jgi:predicted component of type VI protein secretion system
MSRIDPTLSAPSLELFGLQHRSCTIDFSWQWPGALSKAGFDEILIGLEGVDPDVLMQARSCSLQRVGPLDQPVWILSNSSPDLVCTVNQRVLATGSQVRLDHGDEIELGLTRFAVYLERSADLPGMADVLERDPPATDAHAHELAAFELTDLDALADVSKLTEGERYGLSRADFGDLISLTPEERAVPAAVPEVLPPKAPEPSLAEALAAGTSPSYSEKVSDLLAQFSAGVEAPKHEQALVDDPLQALHTQYLAKLRDPVHGDDQDLWNDIVRGDHTKHADPMQQWMQAAGPGHSLDDLLGQPHSIASVIQGLDALGAVDVLAPEPFDSVMHLFSPEHLREPAPDALDTLEKLVQRSLPGLTRREHHSLSLDSAMPFTGGEGQSPKPQ